MIHSMHVYHDGAHDGPTNMARDESLLYSDMVQPAALRIYTWNPPTISLGYFQAFDEVARLPADVRDLAVVRRPTGGGAILHDREITYCLVLSDAIPIARRGPAELYRVVHECWRAALAKTGVESELAPESFPLPTPRTGPFFCFQKPGRTDLIVGTDKLLGSAQRRIPGRVLQHGSLLLAQRYSSHPGANLNDPPTAMAIGWTATFIAALAASLELSPHAAVWTEELLADASERRLKYAADEWTRRR